MNLKKFLLSGIAGGIVFFLLGWLFYGTLLMEFMTSHTKLVSGVHREANQMLYLYLIIGNILSGCLLAYVFLKAGIQGVKDGFLTGAVIGFFVSAGYDCISYATTYLTSRTVMATDVAIYTFISAVAGIAVSIIAKPANKPAN